MRFFLDMSNLNRKYKKESCRTLLGFLRCLTGQCIQLDLYAGMMLVGQLNAIDVHHNIHLSQVTLVRPLSKPIAFHRLCIRYGIVRFIRLPDQIDVLRTIEQDLKAMNPKPKDIVGGGQKKRQVKKGHEYEKNLPVLRPDTQ